MATIRQKGPNQWHVQVRKKGFPTQTRTFKTKKDAKNWGNEVETEIYRQRHQIQRPQIGTSLGQLIDCYIEEVTKNRPSENSRTSERLRLQRFQREEKKLCSYDVRNLQPEHFNDYKERRLKEPSPKNAAKTITAGTVKRELTMLKRVIDHKRRELGIQTNPVNTEDVKRPAVNDERDVRLTKLQRQNFISECYAAKNTLLGPLVEFAFETGARRNNILRLEWDDIDLVKRSITLRAIKNSRSPEDIKNHLTGISPKAIEILNGLSRDNQRVFPLTDNALRKAFERARDRAEVSFFNFHDIRHERISNLVEAGWSILQIMGLTGHKDVKSLSRYTNIPTDYISDELAKLDND